MIKYTEEEKNMLRKEVSQRNAAVLLEGNNKLEERLIIAEEEIKQLKANMSTLKELVDKLSKEWTLQRLGLSDIKES